MEVHHVPAIESAIPLTLAAGSISNGQIALIAVVVVAITLSLVSNARRRRERGPSPKAYAREQIARLKEDQAVQKDVADVMLQLQQLAREVNAQLDNNFIRLEKCIADADERIDRLDRLIRRADGEPTVDAVVEEADGEAGGEALKGQALRDRVCELHEQGRSPKDIARTLARALGEIELIIALYGSHKGQKLSAHV